MLQLCVRLFVALVTFALGVSVSTLLGWMRPAEPPARPAPMNVFVSAPRAEAPVAVARVRPESMIVNGGILNGKAFSMPEPAYPPIARAARAKGTVVVSVVLDEDGRVASATAESGHPLLQQAAVAAAREARFAPTRISGQPVRVKGRLVYNFVPE